MKNSNHSLGLAIIMIALWAPFTIASIKIMNYAKNNVQHLGRVELADAIAITEKCSSIKCSVMCGVNSHCASFFHNTETEQCVMHSKVFHFEMPSIIESGWKYFVSRKVGTRCPYPYFYYKTLDFCYLIDEIENIDFQKIKEKCGAYGGILAAIENQQKYDFFRCILAGRPHKRVALEGIRISANEWRLQDNSVLTFFNWHSGEPDSQTCLELSTDDKHFDCDCLFSSPKPAVFLCEI